MNDHELKVLANEVIDHLRYGAAKTHNRTLVEFDLDDQNLVENGKYFMNDGAYEITNAILGQPRLKHAVEIDNRQILVTDFFMNQQKMDGVSLEAHKCFTVIENDNAMFYAHSILALIAAEQPYFASWIAFKMNGKLAVQMINDAWSVRTLVSALDAGGHSLPSDDNVLKFKIPKK